jgi:hypothetical protein
MIVKRSFSPYHTHTIQHNSKGDFEDECSFQSRFH